MERSMEFFMKGAAKQLPEESVVVSKRFLNKEGGPIPFELRAITTEKVQELRDECTKTTKSKRGTVEKFDNQRFIARLCIESTTYPDFKSKALLDSYGLVDPVDLVKAILNVPGEYAELIQAAQRVNGFDEDFEELVEEAKN